MAEVIGGKFWKPYGATTLASPEAGGAAAKSTSFVIGQDPGMFQARAPIDLTNPRLRRLAGALGPAYVRVSGTWANSVFFRDSAGPAPAKAAGGVSRRADSAAMERRYRFQSSGKCRSTSPPSQSAQAFVTRPAYGHPSRRDRSSNIRRRSVDGRCGGTLQRAIDAFCWRFSAKQEFKVEYVRHVGNPSPLGADA